MKNILFILLFFTAIPFIYCQNTFSGTVLNQETGEPVIGATVYFPQLEKASSTSLEGFFEFKNLPSGNQNIVISALGYATFSQTINVPIEEDFIINLRPSAIEMEEIIISTPFHKLQSENVMKISRATVEQLERQGSVTLAEGITNIPGVESVTTGAGIGKPVIRGLSSNRVLVYTQGVRLENQQFGDEHGLGVSSSGIESVEVIKGPASLLYGSDALGGVLYLNPEKYAAPDSTNFDVGVRYHSNTLGTEANLGFKSSAERLKFLIRGNYVSHSDYETGNGLRVTNSRFTEYDLKTGVGFQNEKIRSDLRYNYNGTTVGIPEELGIQNTSKEIHEPYQQIKNHIISLDNRLYLGNSSIDAKIGYLFNNRKEFEEHEEHDHHDHHDDEEPHDSGLHEEHGEEPALEMHLSTFNYDLKYNFPKTGNLETIIGLQGMIQNNENLGEEILIPDARTIDAGIFATSHFHLEKIDLQAGIRFDNRRITTKPHHNPDEPEYISALERNFNSFNAAFGVKYDITESFVARLNLSSGFRAPNLAELTSKGSHHGANRYEVGNSALENEQSFQIDLALEYGNEHFEIFGNGFINNIKDYIYLQPTGEFIDDDLVFNYIQNDAQLYGAEAGVHLHPHPLDWLHLESSFETVTGIREDDEYLPLIPATSFLNTLRIEPGNFSVFEDFHSFLSLKTVLAQNKTSNFETSTGGYSLLNAGFGGSFSIGNQPLQLQLSGNNLLNRNYISHLSRLKPDGIANRGRNISISLKTIF